jgi:hypothetical protein
VEVSALFDWFADDFVGENAESDELEALPEGAPHR